MIFFFLFSPDDALLQRLIDPFFSGTRLAHLVTLFVGPLLLRAFPPACCNFSSFFFVSPCNHKVVRRKSFIPLGIAPPPFFFLAVPGYFWLPTSSSSPSFVAPSWILENPLRRSLFPFSFFFFINERSSNFVAPLSSSGSR